MIVKGSKTGSVDNGAYNAIIVMLCNACTILKFAWIGAPQKQRKTWPSVFYQLERLRERETVNRDLIELHS